MKKLTIAVLALIAFAGVAHAGPGIGITMSADFSGNGSIATPFELSSNVTMPGIASVAGTAGTATITTTSTQKETVRGIRTLTASTEDNRAALIAFNQGTVDTSLGSAPGVFEYGVRGGSFLTRSAGAVDLYQWAVYGQVGLEGSASSYGQYPSGVVGSAFEGATQTVGGNFRGESQTGTVVGVYALSDAQLLDHTPVNESRAVWANARTGLLKYSFYGEGGNFYNHDNGQIDGALNVTGSITENTIRVLVNAGTGLSKTTNTVTLAMTPQTCGAGQHISAATAVGVFTCTADAGGVTNSAAANFHALSNGTNLVSSNTKDDGTTFSIMTTAGGATPKFTVTEVNGNTQVAGTLDSTGNLSENTVRVATVSGAGLTKTGGTFDVVCLTGLTCNADSVQIADRNMGDLTTSTSGSVWTINNNTVTYAKMQDVSATSRILGRITAGAGDPEELTGTQATTLLDVFDSTHKGLVPSGSGGSASVYVNGAGGWSTPTGTNTGSGTSGTLTKWTGTNTLGNSVITESASAITIGSTGGATIQTGANSFTINNTGGGNALTVSSSQTQFHGSQQDSYFNFSNSDTYIRAGLTAGIINIGDTNTGGITLGSSTNATTVSLLKIVNGTGALATKAAGSLSISSCGTGPTSVGDRTGGHVTTGTGATGCTLTWGTAFTSSTPSCIVESRSTTKAFGYTVAAGSLTITSGAASNTYDWLCDDHY